MGKSYNLGVLFADKADNGLTQEYFAGILDSFKRTAEEKGYDISFLNCNKNSDMRKSYLEQAVFRQYDGIIIACIDFDDPEVEELMEKSGIPIVLIDEEREHAISVKSDNAGGIKNMVQYVVSMGHKRLAYILGDENIVTMTRFHSFLDACREAGIEVPKEYIRQSVYRNMKKAAYHTEELLRLPQPPSCILYPDDFSAIGGMNILRARGLNIPEDMSVVGYDGLHILSQYEPRLTTVCQNIAKIGRTAAEKLIKAIENPASDWEEVIVIETRLEKGKTVGNGYF